MLRALMGSRRSAFESWRARRAALVCCVVVPLVGACGRSSLLDEYVQARDAGQPLDGAALVDARPAADLALIGDLALVDLAMPGVGDLAVWADFATPPLADLSARPDFTSTPDLRASSDLAGRADLAASPDLSTVADLASRPDLSAPPDLAVVPDFAMPQDLALPPDLTTPPDLTMPPDLFVSPAGCADGTREGFVDPRRFPAIAGCSGGFAIAGVTSATALPACGRGGGNSGMNPLGKGCNVEDLCAVGWHVCRSAADVRAHAAGGCVGAASDPGLFFVTRQSSTGCGVCALGMNLANPPCDSVSCTAGCAQTDSITNDVFGCGSAGDAPASCDVLDRFGNNLCGALPAGWSCGMDGLAEAKNVVHADASDGGALCCHD